MAAASSKFARSLFALALGSLWPWANAAIIVLCGHFTFPLVVAIGNLGYRLEASNFALQAGLAMIWAVASGIVVGVPLGLAITRPLWPYWITFSAGALAASLFLSLAEPFGIAGFLLMWSRPAAWLGLLSVALFASLVMAVRARYFARNVAAP